LAWLRVVPSRLLIIRAYPTQRPYRGSLHPPPSFPDVPYRQFLRFHHAAQNPPCWPFLFVPKAIDLPVSPLPREFGFLSALPCFFLFSLKGCACAAFGDLLVGQRRASSSFSWRSLSPYSVGTSRRFDRPPNPGRLDRPLFQISLSGFGVRIPPFQHAPFFRLLNHACCHDSRRPDFSPHYVYICGADAFSPVRTRTPMRPAG